MNEDSMKKIVGRLYYLSKDGWDIPKILGWLVRAELLSPSNGFLRDIGTAGRRV